MDRPAVPDLIKVTEIFLIPSSFLVAALGTADTNLHRAAVSLLGVIASVLWTGCSREAFVEHADSETTPFRIHCMCWLPRIFLAGWTLSLLAHGLLWNKPLGQGL